MRGSFIHKDCFDITGNYTPNTTKGWLHVQSELPSKDARMQTQFGEHPKNGFYSKHDNVY